MFEDLRKQNQKTRAEVALETNRSVNYILKAEQATFPGAPAALMQYWVERGHSEELLRSSYRSFQRRQRIAWLQEWEPVAYTSGVPFRMKWIRRTGVSGFEIPNLAKMENYPSQYALSVGLCLPAAVLYRNEIDLKPAGAIMTCMGDIYEYVVSGQYRAEFLSVDGVELEEEAILRICAEEGVKVDHRSSAAA